MAKNKNIEAVRISKNAPRNEDGTIAVPEQVLLTLIKNMDVSVYDVDRLIQEITSRLRMESRDGKAPHESLQGLADDLALRAFMMRCIEVRIEENVFA